MKIPYHYNDFNLDPEKVIKGVHQMSHYCGELEVCNNYLKSKVEKPANEYFNKNYDNVKIITNDVENLLRTAQYELSELIQSVITSTDHIVGTNTSVRLRSLAQSSSTNRSKYKK